MMIHHPRLCLLSISLIALSAAAGEATAKCHPPLAVGALCRASIADLHPTQFAVGMIEVNEREKGIEELSPKKLEDLLESHAAPIVLGPQGAYYVTDHHHLALSLQRAHIDAMDIKIVADRSTLGVDDFWKTMVAKGQAYLFDENGKPQPASKLPENVSQLRDDVYRSLAWAVQKQGGFQKLDEDFSSFLWANFFRPRIVVSPEGDGFDKAVAQALPMAHSPEAADLPGYIAP